ncbi:MAG: amino acid adenylation domain-containing protein [Ferruginibacter sp.]
MKDIHIFFNQLRHDDGAIWLENETIKLSTSKKLQNEETRNFVINNKIKIISILNENNIFSKEKFLKVLIFKDNISDYYPLSPAQERLWFIEQYEQGSNAYHIPVLFELDLHANIKGIKYALQKIISRHEVLRSTIEQVENQEHGIQRVHDKPLYIEAVKLTGKSAYKSLVKEDINRPFNLSAEYPVRVKFYTVQLKKAGPGLRLKRIFLLINIHHIAADGWSIEIFEKELLAWYKAFINKDRGFCLPALEIQYKDYALWQRAFLTGPILEKQLSYWKNKLSNYKVLEIPTDFVRPNRVDYRGAHEKFGLNKEISQKLRALAKLYGTTLHTVMLSSINILLNKYTGQDDIVIGSPIANRQHRQTEGLIGFFVNMQVNRTRLNSSQSFAGLVQKVHQEQIRAQLYQDLPFEKLVDELGVNRDISRHPVFQVMFGVQSFGNQRKRNKQKFSLRPFQVEGFYEVEKFDLSFYVDDSHEELMGQISYATSLFHKNTIMRLVDRYTHLLDQLTEAPGRPYSQAGLLNPLEYNQIIYQWNKTYKYYPKDKTIYQLFEKQSEKTPGNIALVYEGQQLSYQQLNAKSNQLARHIRTQYRKRTKQEPGPDTLVALCVNRGLEMVIGILAILKAGGAYVPIDPGYPQERIDYLLEDTGAQLILSQQQLSEGNHPRLPPEKLIYIGLGEKFYKKEDSSNLPQHSEATNLAYVIYTSGTTGGPKGVKITHRSLNNLVFVQKQMLEINSESKVLQYASLIFDASVWEIFSALSSGAQLSIIPAGIRQDSQLVCDYLLSAKITIALLPPVLLSMMPDTRLPDLKTLLVGGDLCSLETMNKWSKGRRLINAYGPTESTVIATMHRYEAGDGNTKIGKPIANTGVYVLDTNSAPVPIGIIGELYIGGAGVACGYLNKEDLTEQRFIANPFATKADKAKGHTRLYKTGDLVRWLPDGNLEYIGRNDDQVKIRGFRIELGEVEHALSQIRGIRQSCVLAKERETGSGIDKYLVGYYVPDNSDDTITPAVITEKLSQSLPGYMVPGSLVAMESFLLTINGKLDKKALPDPRFIAPREEYVAPTNEIEMEICKIWKKVLGLERVGITDDFFRIGGNSILAIQLSYRMSNALGYDVKVADLFRLKSIVRILAARDQYFDLVKPYHFIQNKTLNNMIFIHPGHGGSEVYQDLADLLFPKYNCIGIDNYNIHHKDKIGSLNKLALYYLLAYEKKYDLGEPVNLLGWSLGGQVTLEIAAILEGRGFKNINVFLLDTLISGESMLSLRKQKNGKGPVKKKNNNTKIEYESAYFEKVAAAYEAERELVNSSISGCLQYTNVVLFKAIQREEIPGNNNRNSKFSMRHFKKLTANNIDLVADNVAVINLNCCHRNILDTNRLTISNYILSRHL